MVKERNLENEKRQREELQRKAQSVKDRIVDKTPVMPNMEDADLFARLDDLEIRER